jgi:hypothetical protein
LSKIITENFEPANITSMHANNHPIEIQSRIEKPETDQFSKPTKTDQ